MIFRALSLSVQQLPSRAFLSVLAKSLALTFAIFIVLGVALGFLVDWGLAYAEAKGWIGDEGWVLSGVIGAALAVVAGWFLFRAVAIPVMGLFGDQVVAAVEDKHYPQSLSTVRQVPISLSIRMGLASMLRVILWNLLAGPLYIVLLVTGIGPLIAFLAVNALLMGRDLGEMVAVRHLERAGVKSWLKQTWVQRALLGAFITVLLMVPFINLVAPLIGAAMAAHLFHLEKKA